ncbi:MAG: hypothetical protein KDD41_03940 [Flavobacteriales bacterium]|nr:hypothetical protein [Flavobacteriales bacterium]
MKRLTYQKRFKLILALAGIFALVIYQLSISDTLELLHKKNELREEVSNTTNAPEEIIAMKAKLKHIEQLVGNETETDIDIHQLLLESVTDFGQKNQVILKEFPQPYTTSNNGYETQTSLVTVEGRFIPLLKLSNHIETSYAGGKIVALDFKAIRELRTRKRKLISTIYIQHVKAEHHENNS